MNRGHREAFAAASTTIVLSAFVSFVQPFVSLS